MFSTHEISILDLAKQAGLPSTEILSFRPNGRKVYDIFLNDVLMVKAKLPRRILLNFNSVSLCDISFIDEVIINSILYCRKNDLKIQLVLCNLDDELYDNIYAAILLRIKKINHQSKKKINLVALIMKNDNLELVGDLESNLEETFLLLSLNSTLTARRLSDLTKAPINSASNKLKKLYDLKLVFREQVTDEEGKYFNYTL